MNISKILQLLTIVEVGILHVCYEIHLTKVVIQLLKSRSTFLILKSQTIATSYIEMLMKLFFDFIIVLDFSKSE